MSDMAIPQPVRRTQVVTDTKQLTVSTVRIRRDYYDTVVFDDSADKRHSGWTIGGFVIDQQSRRAATRDEALEQHHDAVGAAYAEEPQPITERTPCDLPNACDPDTDEPCDRHEREDAHAEGEHELCGDECAAQTGGAS